MARQAQEATPRVFEDLLDSLDAQAHSLHSKLPQLHLIAGESPCFVTEDVVYLPQIFVQICVSSLHSFLCIWIAPVQGGNSQRLMQLSGEGCRPCHLPFRSREHFLCAYKFHEQGDLLGCQREAVAWYSKIKLNFKTTASPKSYCNNKNKAHWPGQEPKSKCLAMQYTNSKFL